VAFASRTQHPARAGHHPVADLCSPRRGRAAGLEQGVTQYLSRSGWTQGEVFTSSRGQKQTGRGVDSSGLDFDCLVDKDENEGWRCKTSYFVGWIVGWELGLPLCAEGYSESAATVGKTEQGPLYWRFNAIASSPVQTIPEEEKCEHATSEDIFGLAIARRYRTVGNFFGGT